MDTSLSAPTGEPVQVVPLDKSMDLRERLGSCLTALLTQGAAGRLEDEALPGELRAVASSFATEEIGGFADAMLGVALHATQLRPAQRAHDAPAAPYRLLGALLGGLDAGRAISIAKRLTRTLHTLMGAMGGVQDHEEHLLAGLLGSLDNAPPALYEWLAEQLRALPELGEAVPRLSVSAVPWLINRVVRMPPNVASTVFSAAMSRCKALPAQDHVALWLACAAPCGGGRALLERTDDGARLTPGVLIEDDDLPVPAAIRELERHVNLLLAASLPTAADDLQKRTALAQVSPHLSGADLDLCIEVLGAKAPFMLGVLFSRRSVAEACLLARHVGSASDTAVAGAALRTIIENLGDAEEAVYEAFVHELARLGGTAAAELTLPDDVPAGARALIEHELRCAAH